jgi:hypothetical protein
LFEALAGPATVADGTRGGLPKTAWNDASILAESCSFWWSITSLLLALDEPSNLLKQLPDLNELLLLLLLLLFEPKALVKAAAPPKLVVLKVVPRWDGMNAVFIGCIPLLLLLEKGLLNMLGRAPELPNMLATGLKPCSRPLLRGTALPAALTLLLLLLQLKPLALPAPVNSAEVSVSG